MTAIGGGMRAKEAKRYRAEQLRIMDRDNRRKARAELRELRAAIADARRRRREAIKAVRAACKSRRRELLEEGRAKRAALREQIKRERRELAERIARLRAELRAEIKAASSGAKKRCASDLEQAIAAGAGNVDKAIRALAEARSLYELIHAPKRRQGPKRERAEIAREVARRTAEARRESDDEVRSNIPDELRPVFERVKSKIHETPYASRTEVFLEWAADHAADVQRIRDEEIEQSIRKWEREAAALERSLRRRGHYVGPPREPGEDEDEPGDVDAGGGEVPF